MEKAQAGGKKYGERGKYNRLVLFVRFMERNGSKLNNTQRQEEET